MTNPFVNDAFAMVWQAFLNLYPGKTCDVNWHPGLNQEGDSPVYGVTVFSDDGGAHVYVDAGLRVNDAVEVLAHELAHVATGILEGDDHGPEWEDAFDRIKREYDRIGVEIFGAQEEIRGGEQA